MQLDNRDELEAALFREWRVLREGGLLATLLPSCLTRQWMHERQSLGYVALDYEVRRGVELPRAMDQAKGSRVDLLEKYWSVRTLDGRQDPSWMPSLNVNVVQVHNETATGAHCEMALRNALLMRSVVVSANGSWFHEPVGAHLYVRAMVIASVVGKEAALLGAMNELHDIPLTVAHFQLSAENGFTFVQSNDVERLYNHMLVDFAAASALAADLLGSDQLPLAKFEWQGSNEGPTYDRAIGLTIHKGRVF